MVVFVVFWPKEGKIEFADAAISGSFGTGFLAFEVGGIKQKGSSLQAGEI